MINEKFVLVGSIVSLIGVSKYCLAVLKGETFPNRVTWTIWFIAPMIAFAAELSKGVGLIAIVTFMLGFNPALVLVTSALSKHGHWKISTFDLCCGFLAVVGLIFWKIAGDGNFAIAFSIAADLLAAIPTARKSYSHPDSESYGAYLGGVVAATIGLLTIKKFSFAIAGFPIYLVVLNLYLVFVIVTRVGASKDITEQGISGESSSSR